MPRKPEDELAAALRDLGRALLEPFRPMLLWMLEKINRFVTRKGGGDA